VTPRGVGRFEAGPTRSRRPQGSCGGTRDLQPWCGSAIRDDSAMRRIVDAAPIARLRSWRKQRAEDNAAFKRRAAGRTTLRKLVEARNEPDVSERRTLIENCLSRSVVLVEEGRSTAGLSKVEERFDEDHQDQKFGVEIVAPVEARGDDVWTRWEISGIHKRPITQTVTARVDRATGLLSQLSVTPAKARDAASPWQRALDNIAANPVAAIGVIGSATYLALRLPAQIFYARLGTTPDEVGLGPQVLVPQSLLLLILMLVGSALAFPVARSQTVLIVKAVSRLWHERRLRAVMAAAIGLLAWIGMIFGGAAALDAALGTESSGSGPPAEVPPPDWFIGFAALLLVLVATFLAPRTSLLVPGMTAARRELAAERRRRKDRWSRRSVLLAGALTTTFVMVFVMSVLASYSGFAVRQGGDAGGELFPWRALPAAVTWKPTSTMAPLTNRCGELRLLGTANDQIVVFDTRVDRAFRIPIGDASVATEVGCLWVQTAAYTRGKHCDAGQCRWDVELSVDVSDDDSELDGVVSVRECDDSGCEYRRLQTIESNRLRLAAGHYRLTLHARDGERRAEQVIGLTVP
jgi:hypothetical protein